MTVGESLTQARYQAGLTIDELSERTKIRSTVIRSIEADDYAACGGDLYVRGYVRAIAGAVGVDAQGLIREFDQERTHAGDDADATSFDLPAIRARRDGPAAREDPDAPRRARTRMDPFDLPPVREDSAATRFDIPAVRADYPEDLMAAGYEVQPAAGGAGRGRARDALPRAPGRSGRGAAAGQPARPARRASSAGRRRRRDRAGAGGRRRRPPGVRLHDRQERGRLDHGAGRRDCQGGQVGLAGHLGSGRQQACRHGHPTPSATPTRQAGRVSARRSRYCRSRPPRRSAPAGSATATTRPAPATRSPGTLRSRGRPTGTRPRSSGCSRAGPACCSASPTRPRSPACAST